MSTSDNERLAYIEKLIQDHAIGVQNVYNEMREIKEILKSDGMRQVLSELKELNDEYSLANMRRRIKSLTRFAQNTEVVKALDDIENLKERLREIFNIDIDYE